MPRCGGLTYFGQRRRSGLQSGVFHQCQIGGKVAEISQLGSFFFILSFLLSFLSTCVGGYRFLTRRASPLIFPPSVSKVRNPQPARRIIVSPLLNRALILPGGLRIFPSTISLFPSFFSSRIQRHPPTMISSPPPDLSQRTHN